MGTFFHPITYISADGQRQTVEALVDTGATFSSAPRDLLESLGVRPTREVRLKLANGAAHVQELGHVRVELDGIEDMTFVLFADEGAPSIIGAITLESFLLGVDPFHQRLVSVMGWNAALETRSLVDFLPYG
jgi:predicted aspartyl protease